MPRAAPRRGRDPREPRPQSAHRGRRAPPGARGLRRARPGLPLAQRRYARGRGSGARADRPARSAADRSERAGCRRLPEAQRRDHGQGGRGRLLLGRCLGQPDRGQLSRGRRRGAVLRPSAGERRRGEDPGALAPALRRPGRAHQRRNPGVRAALKDAGVDYTLYMYEGRTTRSTTTPRKRATTPQRPGSPGRVPSISSSSTCPIRASERRRVRSASACLGISGWRSRPGSSWRSGRIRGARSTAPPAAGTDRDSEVAGTSSLVRARRMPQSQRWPAGAAQPAPGTPALALDVALALSCPAVFAAQAKVWARPRKEAAAASSVAALKILAASWPGPKRAGQPSSPLTDAPCAIRTRRSWFRRI